MHSKRINMFVLKVSRGPLDIKKLRNRFCGCTVTVKDEGTNTLIMVDGLKVKLNVEAELHFVETCRIPPSPQQHGGQVQPQHRGQVQPQQRGPAQPQQRGPAQPQQRGHVQPQQRGPVQQQRGGHVQPQPQQRGLAQTPRGGLVQQRGPNSPHVQQRIPVHVAPPLARGSQVPVTHVAHGGEGEHSIRRDGNHVRGGGPIMLTQGAWGCSESHVPVTNKDGFEWCPRTGGWKC